MALYIKRIPLESLLPIQSGVSDRCLRKLATVATHPAIEVIIYPFDDGEEKYLIADGHHRSYSSFENGHNTIDARVAVDDSGILDLSATAFAGSYCLASVYGTYERWRPDLEALGVVSVSTLRID